MAAMATALGDPARAAAWLSTRGDILAGIASSLSGPASANETNGRPIYAELIGEPHFWWPGPNNDWPPGAQTFEWPPADIFGMSFVQQGVIGAFAAVVGGAGDEPAAAGFDVARFANTADTFRRLGGFLWLTDDEEYSALVPLTHVNASIHADGDRAVIVKGLGWELAWASFLGDDRRLLTLARWLGYAAGTFNLSLPAESYGYDCVFSSPLRLRASGGGCAAAPPQLEGARSRAPRGSHRARSLTRHIFCPSPPFAGMRLHQSDCYGDAGNGEQAGWLTWGMSIALRHLGLLE